MVELALSMFAIAGAPSAFGAELKVPRWQPQDFSFKSEDAQATPFLVDFAATVTRPGGGSFKSLGFFDGDGVWKIRVAPDAEGAWSIETYSSAPSLNGKKVFFECVANDNPNVHGGLRIAPKHPTHFIFEDGTRYFLMGYECDWLWALDTGKDDLPTLNPFLDKLAASGFNQILLNTYAHDTGWRKGKTGPDDYGPPPLYAWGGSNDAPDHSRFNLAFWRHYDRVMEAMRRRGIIAHVMIKVYNKRVNWPAPGSPQDDLFFRWVIARYAAFPNVVWDFSKEAQNEKNSEYKNGRLRFLHDNDPYRRLITVHDDDRQYNEGRYNALLDFRCDQEAADWGVKTAEHLKQKAWPVVNVEYGYEHGPKGPDDVTYKGERKGTQDPKEICRRAWEICMAGGYPAYYYTYTAWDVIRPQDTPPGYGYFKTLRDFFENSNYWLMNTCGSLISEGYCLANPGVEYIVFLNSAKPFTLKIEAAKSDLAAQWRHPFTGQTFDGGKVANGVVTLTPPAEWGGCPVALHVSAAAGK